MKTIAHVKDGHVVNIVVVDKQTAALPAGHTAHDVTATEIAIGDSYDGVTFSKPPIPTGELYFNAAHRYMDIDSAPHRVSYDTVVVVSIQDRPVLTRFAERARLDGNFRVDWPQHMLDQVVPLTANQIIALDSAVTDFHIAQMRTYAAVLNAIKVGLITTHEQVDQPPKPIPPWPPRNTETV